MTPPDGVPDASGVTLRALNFDEKVYLDAVPEAVKKAIDSADGACATILTASFSIATAYGAVVALVAPKTSPSPTDVLIPFIAMAVAVVAAMVGKAAGLKLDQFDTVAQAKTQISNAVFRKSSAWIAIVCLALGMVTAGAVISSTFSKAPAPASQTIALTAEGTKLLESACGVNEEVVLGTAASANGLTTITFKDADATCAGNATLIIPTTAIATIVASE